MQNINIIRPKIELLKGEETKRPDNFIVFKTDESAVDTVIEKEKELLYKAMEETISSEANVTADDDLKYLQERFKNIKDYISKRYYDPAEQVAAKVLKYLKEKLNIREEFLKGWEDGLVGGEEIYYTGIRNGEPVLERTNPLFSAYDRDPNLKYIDEGSWFVQKRWMTNSAIYDSFFDKMSESDLNNLLNEPDGGSNSLSNTGGNTNTDYIIWKSAVDLNNLSSWSTGRSSDPVKAVFHGVWKSYKKIGYLTFKDEETGESNTITVEEGYKPKEGETIEWDWVIEWMEGYKIGDNSTNEGFYLGIQPIEYQDVSIDNPNSQRCPYTGACYNYNNSESKSLTEVMEPLQKMYLILWYRLELTLARDKGKILNMDMTQIPKGLGIDEYKWMHYLTSMGVNFINPYDEGWNIPGREGGRPASDNQIKAVDLGMTQVIGEYIQLLEKIEEMVGELSGVSKQRQGSINTHELVGNVERSVIQSSHITESLFWKHGQIKKRAITNLLNTAKYAWKNYDKKKINYIFNGPERTYLKITDDFLNSDFDIFVSDSSQENRNLESLKSLYQPAMQNGATLLDVANIMTSENISEIKDKLYDLEQQRAKIQQQQTQQEAEVEQNKLMVEQEKNRIQEEDSIRKAETSLKVALIKESNQEVDVEDTSIDEEKIKLQAEKNKKDYELKLRQIKETERSNKAKEQISKKSKVNNNNK